MRFRNERRHRPARAYFGLSRSPGGALGWIPVELVSHGHTITQVENTWTQIAGVVSMALFWGLVGGLIVAAQGKSLQVTPAATRRFLTGLVVCFLIGLPAVYYSNVVFTMILSAGGWGANQAGSEFYLRAARVIGWVLMGLICGAGVGLASGSLRDPMGSLRNVVKGAVGGWVGGFVGGVAFDIIGANASGLYARLFGLCALGLAVGLMIGLVQELTKSAWLNVEAGRLRGRSFNIDRAVATLGRAEENVVGLFGDSGVQARHAVIERNGNSYQLKNLAVQQGVFVNGTRIETAVLNEGDRIKNLRLRIELPSKARRRRAAVRSDASSGRSGGRVHCLVRGAGGTAARRADGDAVPGRRQRTPLRVTPWSADHAGPRDRQRHRDCRRFGLAPSREYRAAERRFRGPRPGEPERYLRAWPANRRLLSTR